MKKINVLKFTNNKEIKFNKLPHDKGIIVDSGTEGYLADPESFIEYQTAWNTRKLQWNTQKHWGETGRTWMDVDGR